MVKKLVTPSLVLGERGGVVSAKLCDQNGKFWMFILHIYFSIFDPFLFICVVLKTIVNFSRYCFTCALIFVYPIRF